MLKYVHHLHLPIILMLFSSFVFSAAMAQNADDNSQEKTSYFKASGSYLSNSAYFGRTDSLTTPYLTPSISYFNKSGLYVTAALSYLASTAESRVDLYSFDLGYDFDLGDHFSGSIFGNKSFYNQSSTAIKSDIKGSMGTYVSYDFNYLQLVAGADLTFATKTDIGLNIGLAHAFLFGEDEHLFTITPTVVANMSTLHFYEGYTSRKIGKKARKLIPNLISSTSVTTVNKDQFTLLDYECSLPLTYGSKKIEFFFIPTIAIPKNPIYTTTTTVNVLKNGTQNTRTKDSTPMSEMSLKNTFFAEAGVYFKF
jgi:hypothetical protein